MRYIFYYSNSYRNINSNNNNNSTCNNNNDNDKCLVLCRYCFMITKNS